MSTENRDVFYQPATEINNDTEGQGSLSGRKSRVSAPKSLIHIQRIALIFGLLIIAVILIYVAATYINAKFGAIIPQQTTVNTVPQNPVTATPNGTTTVQNNNGNTMNGVSLLDSPPVQTETTKPPQVDTTNNQQTSQTTNQKQVNTQPKIDTKQPVKTVVKQGKFYVQVAAFLDFDKATALRKKLVDKGFAAYISIKTIDGKYFYRVRVNGFATKDEALAAVSRIKKLDASLSPQVFAGSK